MRPKSRAGSSWPRPTWAGMQSGIWGGRWAGWGAKASVVGGEDGTWGPWHDGTAGPAAPRQMGVPMREGVPMAGSGGCPRGEEPLAGLGYPRVDGEPRWGSESPRQGDGPVAGMRSPWHGWGGHGEPRGGVGEPLAPAAGAGWEAGGEDKITISGRPDRAMLSGRDLQNGIF